MKKAELLAPAGTMECLRTAFDFGADAVYAAGRAFGLRAAAPNFSERELAEAVSYAHDLGRRLYVAVNAIIHEDELDGLRRYLDALAEAGPDAVIFSDPAVPEIVRELGLPINLHLSTQASTMNSAACRFWSAANVSRVILAREATLEDIGQMRRVIPADMELEVFVHGAMCIAHSGRCLLSSVATGRSGNRGECAQPCRWEYEMRERGSDDEWMSVAQDESGTYILNSRDLMMLDRIPELLEAGVSSLKIEGRMKSAYYVASVVRAYRRAIDIYCESGACASAELLQELEKSSTRSFTHGFFFGNPGADGQDCLRRVSPRMYTFVARVLDAADSGFIRIEQRNKFSVGETLEVLSPNMDCRTFTVDELRTLEGERVDSAPHAQQTLLMRCPIPLRGGELLRRCDGAAV